MLYYIDQSIFGILIAKPNLPRIAKMQEAMWEDLKKNTGETLSLGFNPASIFEALGYKAPKIKVDDINNKYLPLTPEKLSTVMTDMAERYLADPIFNSSEVERRIEGLKANADKNSLPVLGLLNLYIERSYTIEQLRVHWGNMLAWDYVCSNKFLVDPKRDNAPLVFMFSVLMRLRDSRSGYRLAESLDEFLYKDECKKNKVRAQKRTFRLKPPGEDLQDAHMVQNVIIGSYSASSQCNDSEPVTVITCDDVMRFKNRIRIGYRFYDWVLHSPNSGSSTLKDLPKFCMGNVVFFSRPEKGFKFITQCDVRKFIDSESKYYSRPSSLIPPRHAV